MTTPVSFRNASESDFMACVAIARLAWPSFHERESIYHIFCRHFSTTSFVAESDDTLVGFLLGFLSQASESTAYVHLVAVHPEMQGRGIATRLYERFESCVREHGRTRIRLIVNPDNPASLHLHARLGYRPIDLTPTIVVDGVRATRDYNGPGNHMVVFEKSVQSKALRP